MIGAVLQVGDEVTIPGKNKWPGGSKATVLGFAEVVCGRINEAGRRPGIYVNSAWINIRLEDGEEYSEQARRLEMTDKVEYKRRVGLRLFESDDQPVFLCDLPETLLWEGDEVRNLNPEHVGAGPEVLLTVVSINYDALASDRPAYHVSDMLDGCWIMSGDELKRVSRGNVWRFYHGEPREFVDIREEITFYQMMGQTYEVDNPDNRYGWTRDRVLKAIQDGTVHAFTVVGQGRISAIKFRDPVLGRQVAANTLAWFGMTLDPTQ